MTAKPPASSNIPDVAPTAQATPVEPGAPTPDIEKTRVAVESPHARSIGITIIALLGVLYTLYFARDFLMPLVFALLLDFLLSPLMRTLTRFRIPPPISAAFLVVALLSVVGVGVYSLSGQVQGFVDGAPRTAEAVKKKAATFLKPLRQMSVTAEEVEKATSPSVPGKTPEVVVKGPNLVTRLFGTTQRLLASLIEVLILLYFLLAAGDLFLQKLVKVLPNVRDKRKAVEIARATEASVSAYLRLMSAINIGEGLVVTIALYLLGMPNPALWGAAVAIFEFIPYLGALVVTATLAAAALTTFDNVGHALLIPATFLAIAIVQANVVTPTLMGHRLALNPVAVFVGLAFWFWIWGIPGAFIAVPLLATFKIFCDHIESLASVGEFLGERDEPKTPRVAALSGGQ